MITCIQLFCCCIFAGQWWNVWQSPNWRELWPLTHPGNVSFLICWPQATIMPMLWTVFYELGSRLQFETVLEDRSLVAMLVGFVIMFCVRNNCNSLESAFKLFSIEPQVFFVKVLRTLARSYHIEFMINILCDSLSFCSFLMELLL